MLRILIKYHLFFLIFGFLRAQNEAKQWRFGIGAGLDFTSEPPGIAPTCSINAGEGCGSIADVNGNLLFYTNGIKVWNKNHQVMPNGSGLLGDISATQGGLIVKQPGNNNYYYMFSLDGTAMPDGFRYSIVDINLNGGLGDVMVKNVLLYTPSTEKLAAVWHCNGRDVWIVSHEWNNNNFVAHLLSSSGLSTNPVISSVGSIHSGSSFAAVGQMKFSPNGKKLGVLNFGTDLVEMFDFNSASGNISNATLIDSTLIIPYGCEFSPDGSKFYVTGAQSNNTQHVLYQYDVCSGGVIPKVLLSAPYFIRGLQVATNGKIYVAEVDNQTVGVINSPNLAGTACNFVLNGQQVTTTPGRKSSLGLPNFISGYFKQSLLTPFTYTTNCQQVSFDAKAGVFNNPGNCSARYAMTSMSWNFGDPASGSSNVSNVSNPVHLFSAPGTYTVQLVRVFPCNPDTLRQVITISSLSPTFAISGPGTVCKNDVNTLSGNQSAYNYNWKMAYTFTGAPVFTAQGSSIVVSPSLTAYYRVTATDTLTGCSIEKLHIMSVNACLGADERNAKSQSINIYPNPFSDYLNIQSNYKNLQIEIFDGTGNQVCSAKANDENYQIDIRHLPPGIYFVHVENESVKVVQKVMKRE